MSHLWRIRLPLLALVVSTGACVRVGANPEVSRGPLSASYLEYARAGAPLRCEARGIDSNRSITVCVGQVADTVILFQIADGLVVFSRYREWSVTEDSLGVVLAALRARLSMEIGPEAECAVGGSVHYFRGRELMASLRASPGHRPLMRTTIGVSEFLFDEMWLDSMRIAQVKSCRS